MNCFQQLNGPPSWEQWLKPGKTNKKPHSERALQSHSNPTSALITPLSWSLSCWETFQWFQPPPHRTQWWSLLSLYKMSVPNLFPLSSQLVASSGQYGGSMAGWHPFDPLSRRRCVNSSITGGTSPADAQQSSELLIHLSLQLLAAPRSTDSAPESVHSREQESRSSQD